MLGWVVTVMVLLSVVSAAFSGRMELLSQAAISGCSDAVTLMLALTGGLCLWSGLMRIAERSGLTDALSAALRPLLRLLMPGLPENSRATGPMCMNIAANLLGLGNAATPLGLTAIRRLEEEQDYPAGATPEMTVFVVLNTASIQLIPATNALLRMQAGSARPMEILPCVWISSLTSVVTGLLAARMLCRRGRDLRRGRL